MATEIASTWATGDSRTMETDLGGGCKLSVRRSPGLPIPGAPEVVNLTVDLGDGLSAALSFSTVYNGEDRPQGMFIRVDGAPDGLALSTAVPVTVQRHV